MPAQQFNTTTVGANGSGKSNFFHGAFGATAAPPPLPPPQLPPPRAVAHTRAQKNTPRLALHARTHTLSSQPSGLCSRTSSRSCAPTTGSACCTCVRARVFSSVCAACAPRRHVLTMSTRTSTCVSVCVRACAFVFTTLCTHTRSRPQEGAGHAVQTASVEIVFDNSDNRLPVRVSMCTGAACCCALARRGTAVCFGMRVAAAAAGLSYAWHAAHHVAHTQHTHAHT